MNRYKFLLLSFLLFIGGFANAQYLTGPNGVKYFFWRQFGTAQRANIGDLVFVELVGKTEKDSVIMSSYVQGQAFQIFVPKPTYKGCFFEMLTLMGEKDSAEVSVVADSLFLRTFGNEMPPFIRKGSKIRITVKMVSIVTKAEYDKRMIDEVKYANEIQEEDIQKYIKENNLQMTRTPTGLYYMFPLKSFANRVKPGDEVLVHYTGYFLDGKIFDSSIPRNQAFAFTVGSGAVIKGWDEALQMMSLGDKIKIILPYQLAYGASGSSTIPANTPLVFDIELLEIR
jgi:peptidylprolyl isomerase